MLKLINKAAILAVIIVLPCLLLGSACTAESVDFVPSTDNTTSSSAQTHADRITSPVVIPYLVRNPIEIITAEDNVEDHYKRTITINGLSDANVAASINNDLLDVYSKVTDGDLPPYRGIRKLIGDRSIKSSSNIDASMSFNYNNVASVLIYGNRTYMKQDENGDISQKPEDPNNIVNIGMVDAYTVDLNTGEQISLEEVFCDDVDYKSILNDYIAELLMKSNATEEEEDYFSMGGNLKLVSPFKGITDQQKFFLYQGGLGLIFDYSNPEFAINMYPITVYINFKELGDVVAVTERFYDVEKDIYLSDNTPVYEFMQSWNSNDFREQKNEMIDGINIYQSITYNDYIPKQALEKVKSLYAIDEKRLDEIRALIDPASEMTYSLEQYVWTNISGKYTTVTRNTNLSFDGKWESTNENYCYNDQGKEIDLADLFIPEYNFKNIVMNGMINTLTQMPNGTNADVDQLYDGLQFSLGLSEINFATIPVGFDNTAESPVYFSLTFEEIGCENLVIFH